MIVITLDPVIESFRLIFKSATVREKRKDHQFRKIRLFDIQKWDKNAGILTPRKKPEKWSRERINWLA